MSTGQRVVLAIDLLIIQILIIATFLAIQDIRHKVSEPVCYSVTEDSDITGCHYQNGAWYRD